MYIFQECVHQSTFGCTLCDVSLVLNTGSNGDASVAVTKCVLHNDGSKQSLIYLEMFPCKASAFPDATHLQLGDSVVSCATVTIAYDPETAVAMIRMQSLIYLEMFPCKASAFPDAIHLQLGGGAVPYATVTIAYDPETSAVMIIIAVVFIAPYLIRKGELAAVYKIKRIH